MIVDLQQNTPEWLAFRSGKIGASDSPIIMGSSPWATPYQLWERKLNLVPEKEQNFSMKRGHDLEELARCKFEEISGMHFVPKVMVDITYPFIMASFDGVSSDNTKILEIKCPGREDHLIALNGRVPDKYFYQLQHQMMIANVSQIWYYSFDGNTGTAILVDRDQEKINEMLEKEIEFYRCMKEFIPPPMTERDYQIKNSPEFLEVVAQYKNVKKNLRQYENLEAELRGQLVAAACGQNTITNGLRISRGMRKGSVNYEMIPELQGIDLDQYRDESVMSWRITETKEDHV